MLKLLTPVFFLLLGLSPLRESAVPIPAKGFQVTGAVAASANWQVNDLRRQFKSSLRSIAYTRKGAAHTAQALPLWTVLQAAQPRVNPQIKNHLLQFVVLVVGNDGYTAAFSMAELSPDIGGRNAWLALDEDGKPLSEDADQPNLIVPEDKKAGRWVHSVVRIIVVDEAQRGQAQTAGRP